MPQGHRAHRERILWGQSLPVKMNHSKESLTQRHRVHGERIKKDNLYSLRLCGFARDCQVFKPLPGAAGKGDFIRDGSSAGGRVCT